MAIFKNDPFPGTDYTKYLEWQKVILPSGEILYVVPGHPAYAYNPVASNASGRKVFQPNPQQKINDDAQAKKEHEEQLAQQRYISSPLGQLLPVAGTVGGLWAANKYLPSANSDALATIAKGLGNQSGGASALANAAANGAAASGAGAAADASSAFAGSQAAAESGLANSTMAAPEAAIGYAPYLGVAGAGLGAYELYKGIQAGSTGQSALGGAGLGAGLAAAAPLVGLGPVGWGGLALAAAAGALGGGALSRIFGHETTKEHEKKQWGGLASSSNPATAQYAQQYLQYLDSPQAKADAERAKNRDPKTDPWKPEEIWGGAGFFKAIPDWLTGFSADQRRQVSQFALDNGLVKSEKGDLQLTDPSKVVSYANGLRQPGSQATSTPVVVPAPAQTPAVVVAPKPAPNIVSPGMNVQLAVSPQAQAAAQGAVAAGVTGVPRGPFGGPAPVVPIVRGPFGLARG